MYSSNGKSRSKFQRRVSHGLPPESLEEKRRRVLSGLSVIRQKKGLGKKITFHVTEYKPRSIRYNSPNASRSNTVGLTQKKMWILDHESRFQKFPRPVSLMFQWLRHLLPSISFIGNSIRTLSLTMVCMAERLMQQIYLWLDATNKIYLSKSARLIIVIHQLKYGFHLKEIKLKILNWKE